MLSKSKLQELFKNLLIPRYIEEKMLLLLRQGKISKWFSGIGQEAISVGVTFALDKNDYILPMHRNLGVFTTRKLDYYKLFCQLFGKVDGYTKGRDRTFHFGDKDNKIIGMISHLAAMLPVANGLALANKLRKNNNIIVSFTGDGSTSEGDFHEALNIAAVWNLPVIFLVENNGYGLSTPTSEQFKCNKISDKAIGYGMKGITINGNDVLEVYNTILNAKNSIIKNETGPILIEAITFRIRGHEEASGIKYVPKKDINYWKKKDPIDFFERYLIKEKVINNKFRVNFCNELNNEIFPIIEEALNSKQPKTNIDDELNDVYSDSNYTIISPSKKLVDNRFVDSIKNCIYQKMLDDDSVLIMGQDIAEYGGVFKITEGLFDKFGKSRVRNTPIIESGIIGTAMGLSIEGFKPIVEMQFADFVSVGFNQIVNNLAKTYYRWNQSINVTLRLPTGGSINGGPFHSQSNESWFFHVPGLKIVYPSSPYDAKGLLLSSIDENNPVLFFEHKALYRSQTDEIPINNFHIELGCGSIINKGNKITVVTYGLGVIWMKEYLKEKLDLISSIEVIDLRTLLPWDKKIVINSLKKTNKILILHEDNITGSISGEISSYVSENYFEYLDAPIIRLGSIDTPIPFSNNIEKEVYLPINRIDSSIKKLLEY